MNFQGLVALGQFQIDQCSGSVINHDFIHPGNIPQEISDALEKIRLTLLGLNKMMFHLQMIQGKKFFPTKEQIFWEVLLISELWIIGIILI